MGAEGGGASQPRGPPRPSPHLLQSLGHAGSNRLGNQGVGGPQVTSDNHAVYAFESVRKKSRHSIAEQTNFVYKTGQQPREPMMLIPSPAPLTRTLSLLTLPGFENELASVLGQE